MSAGRKPSQRGASTWPRHQCRARTSASPSPLTRRRARRSRPSSTPAAGGRGHRRQHRRGRRGVHLALPGRPPLQDPRHRTRPRGAGRLARSEQPLQLHPGQERVEGHRDPLRYRRQGQLAGRRVLVVADNARDSAHVRALLPGTPGSAVLVTSRSSLGGLAAAKGARLLGLNVLTGNDAAELLAARLGHDRVAAEPQAVAELTRLSGRLPLALAVVATRAALSGWPLTVLAGQLADARQQFALLSLDHAAVDMRAVFSWCCRQLSAESAQMLRLLAVHPGPDISVPVAASMAGVPAPRAQELLRELEQASLAAEHEPGRFTVHDLLRAYAGVFGGQTASRPRPGPAASLCPEAAAAGTGAACGGRDGSGTRGAPRPGGAHRGPRSGPAARGGVSR